jgi:hemoglobin
MIRSIRVPALVLAGLLVAGVAGAGCQTDKSSSSSSSTSGKTLYERLGGHDAIVAVVDDFTSRAASDPAVNFTRKGHPNEWKPTSADLNRFKVLLVQFIESNTGGPKNYEGRPMDVAHKGMEITGPEFDALAGDLKATLDKFKVPQKEQDELLTIVGSTRASIVGK